MILFAPQSAAIHNSQYMTAVT